MLTKQDILLEFMLSRRHSVRRHEACGIQTRVSDLCRMSVGLNRGKHFFCFGSDSRYFEVKKLFYVKFLKKHYSLNFGTNLQ